MDMSVDDSMSSGCNKDTPTRIKDNRRTLLFAAQRGMYEKRLKSPIGFSELPIYRPLTPGRKVYNPFKTDIDLLEGHTCSPTMLSKTESPESSDFTWPIDHISRQEPAPIDSPIELPEERLEDHMEERAQAAIDRYFSLRHNILSPLSGLGEFLSPGTLAARGGGTPASSSTPRHQPVSVRFQDAGSQTCLSFPSVLPPDLEALLKQYNIIIEEESPDDSKNSSSSSSNNSSHRRKLFFSKEDECISPVKRACYESIASPDLNGSMKISRIDWTLEDKTEVISSPDISPIKCKPEPMCVSGGPDKEEIFTSTIISGGRSMDTGYSTMEQCTLDTNQS